MNNFWEKLKKPFFVLAPMADVTDPAFRRIVVECSKHGTPNGGPDVFWTEFVSADGLAHPAAREKLMRDLAYTEAERPIVAQLFGSNTDNMKFAAKLCAEQGYDGVDINMGCPDKTIEKQGAGACMMKTPDVAIAIIRAAREGIKESGKDIPLSVKTRIGYNKNEIQTWIPTLLEQDLAALTVHCRTRKEMSAVPARWEHIKEIVEIRNKMKKETLIIGNGDVHDIADGLQKAKETGCDGVMIGRAIFGNPWIFDTSRMEVKRNNFSDNISSFINRLFGKKDKYWLRVESNIPVEEKLKTLVKHAELFEELLSDIKSFAIMKKHFKAYINGFAGAKELRTKLMEEGNDAQAVSKIINEFLSNS